MASGNSSFYSQGPQYTEAPAVASLLDEAEAARDTAVSAAAEASAAAEQANLIVEDIGDISGLVADVAALETGKEPTVTAGTSGQYYRGDKTFQTLDKTAVGLANVDNTTDLNKPISTAAQTALNLKAASATLLSTTGLIAGGGDLSTNRTFDVPAANAAEAIAGLNATKAITPATARDAIGGALTFTDLTTAASAYIPAAVVGVTMEKHSSVGEECFCRYISDGTTPTHDLKFTALDGRVFHADLSVPLDVRAAGVRESAANNTPAVQRAINTGASDLLFPGYEIECQGQLTLISGQHWHGLGRRSEVAGVPGGTIIRHLGAGAGSFIVHDQDTTLSALTFFKCTDIAFEAGRRRKAHGSLDGSGNPEYSNSNYVFNLESPRNCYFTRCSWEHHNQDANHHCWKSEVDGTDEEGTYGPSWSMYFTDCQFQCHSVDENDYSGLGGVLDDRTPLLGYALETDLTAGFFKGCYFIGSLKDTGNGGNKFAVCQFDSANATGAAAIERVTSEATDQIHTNFYVGCVFGLSDIHVKIDVSAAGDGGDFNCGMAFVGCNFRSAGTADFHLTGPAAGANGPTVVGCVFHAGSELRDPIVVRTNWKFIHIADCLPRQPGGPTLLANGDGRSNSRGSVSIGNDAYGHDGWYLLSNGAGITTSSIQNTTTDNIGMFRLSPAASRRFGYARIIRSADCLHLRGKQVTLHGAVQCSAAVNYRYAILEWTGAADTVTSNVVADWTNGTFTLGQFFANTNLALPGLGETGVLTAAALKELTPLTVTLGNTFTNLIVFGFSQSAIAAAGTLDMRFQLDPGFEKPFEVPPLALVATLAVPEL